MDNKTYGFETLQIHAGYTPDPTTGSMAVPIYQTSAYAFEDAQYAADLFSLSKPGNIYTRLTNPTTAILEERIAALEGGVGALATASGMSAELYAILNIAQNGDEIASTRSLYGGTHTLFSRLENQFGIKVRLFDQDDFETIHAAINEKTKLVNIETLGNPQINIPDIEKIAEIAHSNGLPLVIDNTFGTPYLINVKSCGADIITHSMTKYLGGHGNSLGGVVVDCGTFDWKCGKFPLMTKPDPSYHGLVYADIGANAYILKMRVQLLRDTGACISPFNSFLFLMGLETLSLRMEKHCRNAEAVADYLNGHSKVAWIKYPYLKGDKYYDRAQKYFPKGVGGILSFGLKGDRDSARVFTDSLSLLKNVSNLADAKSLVTHPASTTHSQLSDDELRAASIPPELLRLSIGLEDVNDIIADLEKAFSKV